MKLVSTGTAEFEERIKHLVLRRWTTLDELSPEVDRAISDYRLNREVALVENLRSNGFEFEEKDLWVDSDWIKASHKKVPAAVRKAIDHAKERIERFQDELKPTSFEASDEAGVRWGTEIRPLDRVGIYVPGGRVNYFMTLLLCAIPAKAMGVEQLIVATPPKSSLDKPYVDFALLYCCKLLGIENVLLASSVLGVSALAFGTARTQPVQKIVGSGGLHTSIAKMRLAGYVGIDGVAGPFETAFVADQSTSFETMAADMIGRADHDPQAEIMVFHNDRQWIERLIDTLATRIQSLKSPEEQKTIQACFETRTTFFKVKNTKEAIDCVNRISPGVVSLNVDQPHQWISKIKSCGALLLGPHTPPVGLDLFGAPSGLVNTMGTADFSVSMSPTSFMRRFTLLEMDQMALSRHEEESLKLAQQEGYLTHGASFKVRG